MRNIESIPKSFKLQNENFNWLEINIENEGLEFCTQYEYTSPIFNAKQIKEIIEYLSKAVKLYEV